MPSAPRFVAYGERTGPFYYEKRRRTSRIFQNRLWGPTVSPFRACRAPIRRLAGRFRNNGQPLRVRVNNARGVGHGGRFSQNRPVVANTCPIPVGGRIVDVVLFVRLAAARARRKRSGQWPRGSRTERNNGER